MFENFSKIFIINLDQHTKRWQQTQEELAKYGVTNYERFPGIKINGGITQQDREAGCRASHVEIIKKCQRDNIPNVLIFEDDIDINPELIKLEPQVQNFWKNNTIDLLYFGGNYNSQINERINSFIVKVKRCFTTHAYVVNQQAYQPIISLANINQPIDILLTNIQAGGASYCVDPRMIYQRHGYSYIIGRELNYDVVLKDK
jgi:GR25 family glycosyltransferase involved in LPS biosynthesis